MKKNTILAIGLAGFCALGFTTNLAHADPNSIVLTQRNSTDTGNLTRVMATPSGPAMVAYDTTTSLPIYMVIGSGFSISSGVISAVGSAPSWSSITGKPTFATVATTGAYTDLSGTPTFATVATSGLFSDLLSKPTTFGGYGITDGVSASSLTTTLAGYVTSSSLTSALGGYATTSALSSGLSGKFNTPAGTSAQYVRGDGTLATLPSPSAGTVTSVGVTSTTLNVSGSPVTSSGSITINTVARSFSYPTRALSTCFQISATRDAQVNYAVDVTTTLTLTAGSQGTVALRSYTNSSCTTGGQTIVSGTSGLPATLSVTVGLSNLGTVVLSGVIPAGTWVQIEPTNTVGTPTYSPRQAQEVLL